MGPFSLSISHTPVIQTRMGRRDELDSKTIRVYMTAADIEEEYILIVGASTACAVLTSLAIVLGNCANRTWHRVLSMAAITWVLGDVFSPAGVIQRELCRDIVPPDLRENYDGLSRSRVTCIRSKDCLVVRKGEVHDFSCKSPSSKVDMLVLMSVGASFAFLSGIV